MTASSRRRLKPFAGPLVGSLVTVPVVAVGLAYGQWPVLPFAAPLFDTVIITCLLVTAVISGLDASASRQRQPLSFMSLSLALAVVWTLHLVAFPGVVPWFRPVRASQLTSSTFLIVNVATPLFLAATLFADSRLIRRPAPVAVAIGASSGVGVGIALVLVAALLSQVTPGIDAQGHFDHWAAVLGAAGAAPALAGLFLVYGRGYRPDERQSPGITAAFVFTIGVGILSFELGQRYTAAWYADHLLAALPALALISGQAATLAAALRAEIQGGRRLRMGLELAEAMARQRELGALIDRLLAGSMDAVDADRVTLMSIEGPQLRVEASIDRAGTPVWPGHTVPIRNFRVDGVPVVEQVVESGSPATNAAYDPALLTPEHAQTLRGVRHYLTWPLVLAGETDAVLFLARRRDQPFDTDDMAALGAFASIAALLLRNGRLLRSAEAASIAKGNFLNLAAHELRTPVSVIRGYLDLLKAGDLGVLSEAQRGVVGTLAGKAEELSQQVEQLLVASRLENPREHTVDRDGSFDLLAAVHEAVDRARPRAALLGARIDVSGIGTQAIGSAGEIGLVLDNLVNNAMTYSRGKPWLEIEVGHEDPRAGGPYVRVRDHGIGIAPEDAERVFDRFHRVDRPDFSYPGGTGLGLFIARELALANGGGLELESSEVDAGSTFLLRTRPALVVLDSSASVPA